MDKLGLQDARVMGDNEVPLGQWCYLEGIRRGYHYDFGGFGGGL
jgi:hypothetical protein